MRSLFISIWFIAFLYGGGRFSKIWPLSTTDSITWHNEYLAKEESSCVSLPSLRALCIRKIVPYLVKRVQSQQEDFALSADTLSYDAGREVLDCVLEEMKDQWQWKKHLEQKVDDHTALYSLDDEHLLLFNRHHIHCIDNPLQRDTLAPFSLDYFYYYPSIVIQQHNAYIVDGDSVQVFDIRGRLENKEKREELVFHSSCCVGEPVIDAQKNVFYIATGKTCIMKKCYASKGSGDLFFTAPHTIFDLLAVGLHGDVAVGCEKKIIIIDKDGNQKCTLEDDCLPRGYKATTLAFSPSGRYLVSLYSDRFDRNPLRQVGAIFAMHKQNCYKKISSWQGARSCLAIRVLFSSDERFIALHDKAVQELQIFDTEQRYGWKIADDVQSACLSPSNILYYVRTQGIVHATALTKEARLTMLNVVCGKHTDKDVIQALGHVDVDRVSINDILVFIRALLR